MTPAICVSAGNSQYDILDKTILQKIIREYTDTLYPREKQSGQMTEKTAYEH